MKSDSQTRALVLGRLLAALIALAIWAGCVRHPAGTTPPGSDLADSDLADRGPSKSESAIRGFTDRVERIVDGDTLKLASGTVRLLGIDSPERESPGYDAAVRAAERALDGRHVEVVGQDHDRYGRRLAWIYYEDPQRGRLLFNAEAVRLGVAWMYSVGRQGLPEPYRQKLLIAQKEALADHRGIWAGYDLTRPDGLRATRFRIHRTSCQYARTGRPLASLHAELARGKSPCRTCRPLRRLRSP